MNKKTLPPQVPNIASEQLAVDPGLETAAAPAEPILLVAPKKKPQYLPLLFLLVCAIGFTGVIILISRSQSPVSNSKDTVAVLPTPKPLFLTVDNLQQAATTVDGELLVQGSTLPSATVIMYSDLDETSVESDGQGRFQDTLVVGEQGGLVRVTAYDETGQEQSTTLNISDESSNVLGKSDAKVGQGKNDPKPQTKEKNVLTASLKHNSELIVPSSVRPVKTQASTQIKSPAQTRLQAEKPQEIKDFLADKTEVKKVEKIGAQKMLALLSRTGTVSAQPRQAVKLKKMEVAVASSGAQLKRHAVSGVITNITDGVITLAHQVQRDRVYTIYANTSTLVALKGATNASLTDLTVGMRIAVVGVPSSDGLLASRIHVIPGKATGVFKKNPVASPATTSAKPTLKPSPTATASAIPTVTPSPTATSSASPAATLFPEVTP